MNKRFISLILLGTAFILILISCKKESASSGTKAVPNENINSSEIQPEQGASLRIWESKGLEGDFILFAIEKFKEKYGIDVVYEEVQTTDNRARMETDGPAGTGADVFVMPHDHMGAALASGIIMENLVSADRIKNDFLNPALIAVSSGGKVYGFPLSIETYALFYNKDLLPSPPQTFEELIDWGKGFTDKSQNKYGIFWEIANFYYTFSFFGAQGGYVFGENGTNASDIGLNNNGSISGFEQMLALKEISAENTEDVEYAIMMGLFGEGKAATMIVGPWAFETVKDSGVNYAIAPLPTFNGKHLTSFSGLRVLFVSTFTRYPKAAQIFAKFLTSDEMLMHRYKFTGMIPPVKALMERPEIKDNPDVSPFLQQAQYALPMPSIPEMQSVWTPMEAAVADVWNGKMQIKESLDHTVQVIKDQINAQN